MRKIFFFVLSLIVGLIAFGFITSKVGAGEIVKAFALFSWQGLFLILFLTFLISIVSTFRLKYILKTYGHELSMREVGAIWASGFAVSFLTPIAVLGGEFFIIYILRKAHSLSWKESIAVAFVNKIMDATIFLPFLILGLFIFPVLSGFFPGGKIIILGGGVAAFFIVLLSLFYIKSMRNESVLAVILKFFGSSKKRIKEKKGGEIVFDAEEEILDFFGLRKKKTWIAIGLAVLKYLLIITRCWFLIFFFQGGVSILKALSIYGFFNLASLIPVPAMLGSLEVAESVAFSGLGMGSSVGIAFSLLIRSMDILIVIAGIALLIRFGMKIAQMKITNIIDKLVSGGSSMLSS